MYMPYPHYHSPALNFVLPHHGFSYAMVHFALNLCNVLYSNQTVVQYHSLPPLTDLLNEQVWPTKDLHQCKWVFTIRKAVVIPDFGRPLRKISAWPRDMPRDMAAPKQRHEPMKTIKLALQAIKPNNRKGLDRIQESYGEIVQVICPETGNTGIRPRNYTVVWSLATFILFVVLSCVAVRVTTTPMRISYASISSGLFLILVWIIVADLAFDCKLINLWVTIVVPKDSRTTRTQTKYVKHMHHRHAHGSVDGCSVLLPMVSETQHGNSRTL